MGLGASAGGLNALQAFFQAMPPDSDLAFVVVVHLSPDYESHLASILSRHTAMPVMQVTESVTLERNQVYVIPPNRMLTAVDSHLRISPPSSKVERRVTVDHFFRSLADFYGENAICMVLSGTGSDGTLGLKRVKERGGFAIVQNPEESEYQSMPQSAIAAGTADLVLPVAKMPEAILGYISKRVRIPESEHELQQNDRDTLGRIFSQVRIRFGHDFSQYKHATMLRRLRRRMQILQIDTLEHYLSYLRNHESEVGFLFRDFMISVTNFFRDRESFTYFAEEIVPRLFQGKAEGSQLRAWVVGCASGEEAYSIAMVLLDHARGLDAPVDIQVFASDISDDALFRAREGFYSGRIAEDVPQEKLDRYFTEEQGGYRIRKEVRDIVLFAPHNVLKDPPFSRLDLISCRNMLIYLKQDAQQKVLQLFHYALRTGGYLFLGPSESVTGSEYFRDIDKHHSVFQRQEVPPSERHLPFLQPSYQQSILMEDRRPENEGKRISYGALHQRVVERYANPSILVNDGYTIVHLSENAGRYLQQPGGEPTDNLLKRIRDELRLELTSCLYMAQEKRSAVRSAPVTIRIDGGQRQVILSVRPSREPEISSYLLVMFDESEPAVGGETEEPKDGRMEATARKLEDELDSMKRRLQSTIEEYETSKEEMKATNEELQSMNEELKSTAEELETSKEELQSMNEELVTVNQENKNKVEELSLLTNDLQNLLSATEIATLFLDRDLRIKRFTPKVSDIFNILGTDRGRPLSDLTHKLVYSSIIDDARSVLRTLVPVEREVADSDGRWYLVRILPYRTTEDRIDGVVITGIDIDGIKHAEEDLQQSRDSLTALKNSLEERVRERTSALEQKNEQIHHLVSQLVLAEQRERHRVARLLHDDLQQLLYGVQMRLGMLRKQFEAGNGEDHFAALGESIDLVRRSVDVTRRLSVDLSPPVIRGEGIVEMIQWLANQIETVHDLDVNVEVRDTPVGIRQEIQVLVFQLIRELLFNIVKHAQVGRADIAIEEDDLNLRIRVSDKGAGFDPAQLDATDDDGVKTGLGLSTMRERLGLFGGRLIIDSKPGDGTVATIEIPHDRAKKHAG